jgi:hypothetical protein
VSFREWPAWVPFSECRHDGNDVPSHPTPIEPATTRDRTACCGGPSAARLESLDGRLNGGVHARGGVT